MASALWSIPVLFARTVLAPLHLAPSSLSAVKLEFSPFLTQHTEGKELTNGSSNGVAKKTEKGADVPQPDIADLDRVVKEGCPSLLGEYKPTPWLSG